MTARAVTFAVVALVASAGRAAEASASTVEAKKLSLADCLARLDGRNPLIAASAEDVHAAEAAHRAVEGKKLPTVSLMAFAGPTPKAEGDALDATPTNQNYAEMFRTLGPFFRAELGVVQPLYTFGKIDAGSRATHEAALMQRSKADQTRWELVGQVKTLYYGWLMLDHLKSLLDDVEGKVKQAREYIDEQLAAGDSDLTELDRMRVASFANETRLQRMEVDKRFGTLRDGLTRLLVLAPDTAWQPADERLEAVAAPDVVLANLVARAEGNQPELVAARHGEAALEAKASLYRARFYPDVFLGAQLRYGVAPNREHQDSPFAVDNFNFFDGGVALGLRYQFDVGVVGPEADQVAAELAGVRARVRALTERVRHDVVAAYGELQGSRQQVEVATDGYRTGRAWVALAYERFELGTASAKDLVDGLAGFVKARYTYLQTALDHNLTVARLSAAVGEELQPELRPTH